MNSTSAIALATIALGATLSGNAQRDGLSRIRVEDLRADLTFLASDALEGRRSLDRGSEVAIQFLAAEFAKAGIKPAYGDSYLQPVPLIEYRMDRDLTSLTIERDGKRRALKYNADFFGGSSFESSVDAPVVFAGYGITAPEFAYDDYAAIDAHGKIVLVFEHEPQENDPHSIFNGTGNTRHANSLLKILNAQKHGAVGVLSVSEPNRRHPSNQERTARIPGGEQRARRLPPQALADGEISIPSFSISDALAAELLAGTGKEPAELQSAIDTTLKPASQTLPDTRATMRTALEERRRGTSILSSRTRPSFSAHITITMAPGMAIYAMAPMTMARARRECWSWRGRSRRAL